MYEAFKEVGIEFPGGNRSAIAKQPTYAALDSVAADVASQGAAVLPIWLGAVRSMWTDQFDSAVAKDVAKPIRVGRLVIQQAARFTTRLAAVDEELDRVDFGVMGSGGVGRQRQTVPIGHQQDAGAVPFRSAANLVTPLFARENEPSPIASSQLIRLTRSSLPRIRSHAAWKAPLRVQSRCLLQHVDGEGYRSGKSFQRLPEVRIQRIPSRQGRDKTRGRPPTGETGGSGNKSAIKSHWASVRNGDGAVLDPVRFDRRRGGHRNRVMSMSVSPFTDNGMQLACHHCSVIKRVLQLPHVLFASAGAAANYAAEILVLLRAASACSRLLFLGQSF